MRCHHVTVISVFIVMMKSQTSLFFSMLASVPGPAFLRREPGTEARPCYSHTGLRLQVPLDQK